LELNAEGARVMRTNLLEGYLCQLAATYATGEAVAGTAY
jgi:hypothetical protein